MSPRSNTRPCRFVTRFAAAAWACAAASALAGPPGVFEQIVVQPFGVGMFEPSISADGMRVAFRTAANLSGQNADGSFEVFVYDRSTGLTNQVTSTPGGSGTAIAVPMILPDGSKVVFRTAWDFTLGAPGATFQLWEVDATSTGSGPYRQVTSNPASTPVFDPRMSGDGNFLVFLARINPSGQNADGSLEVFRIDRVSGATIQISNNTTVATQFPDINGDGSRIVWGDRANYDGTNTNGGLEIWAWTQSTGAIAAVTNQTAGVLETNLPRIDSEGRHVSFVSLFDFSGAGATGRKVFVADTQTGIIRRITSTGVGGSGADYPDAEMAPDGSRVYFESNINLTGSNADGNRELFFYDVGTSLLTQLTATTGGSSIVALSDDATRRAIEVAANGNIAYRTDQDLDPNVANALNNLDLFIGACAFVRVSPVAPTANVGDAVVLSSSVRPAGANTYQWRKDGVAIDAAANPSAATSELTLASVSVADGGVYDVVATSSCGSEISSRATLTVNVPLCPADFNESGGAPTVQDIFDFLEAYFNNDPRADFNGGGGITVQDIFDFLAAYFTACP